MSSALNTAIRIRLSLLRFSQSSKSYGSRFVPKDSLRGPDPSRRHRPPIVLAIASRSANDRANSGEGGEGVGDAIGQQQGALVHQRAATVDHIRHIAITILRGWAHQGMRQARQYFRRIALIEQAGAEAVVADGATPWEISNQPSSISIGEPQLPIRTNSHGQRGSMTTAPPSQLSEIVGLQQPDVLMILSA